MKYGIIGNCKTAALVHENGSLDWCCMPSFDSSSIFARLLDPSGGFFHVRLEGAATIKQSYLPQTNILQTEFCDGQNAFALLDFMPRFREGINYQRPVEIIRMLKPLRGKPVVRVSFQPRLNYARGQTFVKQRASFITASCGLESLFLYSDLPLDEIVEECPIVLDRESYLLLTYHEKIHSPTKAYVHDTFIKTKDYWETWSSRCRLPKIAPEMVLRSALTLKLMTYEDTGAIIAAPTTSLPEIIGEGRNWDYRFCWLRDSSLMLEALKSIGHFEEARAFIGYLLRLFECKQTQVRIVYGIHGNTDMEETILEHLNGYKNSRPVRIGNKAVDMRQHDIFGEVLNTIYLYYCHYEFEKMQDDGWSLVKFLVNTIAQDWDSEDSGIWEYRNQKAHFTFSKTLSWVALDRGIAIAEKLGKGYIKSYWCPIADRIRSDIEKNGWNDSLGSYAQIYGSKNVDASLLLMARCGFLKSEDPRWIGTVLRCQKDLQRNGHVFRYTSKDDFGKPKSAFILASLWLAKALYSIGKKRDAMELFNNVLTHANHLGLLSEDIDPQSGELLGNFPQAYSHMAVINTANALSQSEGQAIPQ